MAMVTPPDIKRTVAFIFPAESTPGTGFWVKIRSTSNPDQGWVYLVTARHVVEDVSDITVRVNLASKLAFESIDIEIGSGIHKPLVHPNSDVDIAVIPLVPPQDADGEELTEALSLPRIILQQKNSVRTRKYVRATKFSSWVCYLNFWENCEMSLWFAMVALPFGRMNPANRMETKLDTSLLRQMCIVGVVGVLSLSDLGRCVMMGLH